MVYREAYLAARVDGEPLVVGEFVAHKIKLHFGDLHYSLVAGDCAISDTGFRGKTDHRRGGPNVTLMTGRHPYNLIDRPHAYTRRGASGAPFLFTSDLLRQPLYRRCSDAHRLR